MTCLKLLPRELSFAELTRHYLFITVQGQVGLHAYSAFLQAAIAFATWLKLALLRLMLLDLTQWKHFSAVRKVLAMNLSHLEYFGHFRHLLLVLLNRNELSTC